MIKLDLQSRMPIYEYLKEQITKLTMLGVLDADEKLPSVRTLARDVGINPNTVQKAYQDLERDGIIYTISGRGSFIAGGQDTRRQIREKALEEAAEAVRRACVSGCGRQEITTRVEKTLEEENAHD